MPLARKLSAAAVIQPGEPTTTSIEGRAVALGLPLPLNIDNHGVPAEELAPIYTHQYHSIHSSTRPLLSASPFLSTVLISFSSLRPMLIWAAPAALAFLVGLTRGEEPKLLVAGTELRNEMIRPGMGQVNAYTLGGLEASAEYEARISYPATMPARFTMKVLWGSGSDAGGVDAGGDKAEGQMPDRGRATTGRRRTRRRMLLDTEKVVFSAEPSVGASERVARPLLEVYAEAEGVSYLEELRHRPVVYNIILEKHHLGLTLENWKMIGACIVLVAISCRVAPWLADRIVQEATAHSE